MTTQTLRQRAALRARRHRPAPAKPSALERLNARLWRIHDGRAVWILGTIVFIVIEAAALADIAHRYIP